MGEVGRYDAMGGVALAESKVTAARPMDTNSLLLVGRPTRKSAVGDSNWSR